MYGAVGCRAGEGGLRDAQHVLLQADGVVAVPAHDELPVRHRDGGEAARPGGEGAGRGVAQHGPLKNAMQIKQKNNNNGKQGEKQQKKVMQRKAGKHKNKKNTKKKKNKWERRKKQVASKFLPSCRLSHIPLG